MRICTLVHIIYVVLESEYEDLDPGALNFQALGSGCEDLEP